MLGTEVDDESGVIAAPLTRRREVFKATLRTAGLRTIPCHTFQVWAGICTPILLRRRQTMAAFHSIYRWASRMPETGEVPIPGRVRDEVVGVALMVVMAQSCARWKVQDRLVATDAIPVDAGAADGAEGR